MGTYPLGAQPPRWVHRRAQDSQLGAGYVHRIFAGPPYPLPLPPYLHAHSSKCLAEAWCVATSNGYLSEVIHMNHTNMV